jgi:hypothetical protein
MRIMYRICSSCPPAARLVLGVLAFVALALPAPAAAQGRGDGQQDRPERPFRGLFGAAPSDGSTGTTLSFTASVTGGYDDNIVSDQPNLAPGVAVGGAVYNGSAGLMYSRSTTRSSLGMNLSANKRYFPSNTDLNAGSYGAGIGFERNLSRRTRISLGQNVAYVPFYQFSLFPGLGPPELGSTAPSNLDYAVTPQESWILNSNAELSRDLGRRSSVRMFYGYGYQNMSQSSPPPVVTDPLVAPVEEPVSDLITHTAGFQFRRSLTRHAGLRLGYSYRSGGYQFANASDVSAHNIDVGVDYARTLSIFRRTTFSFGTGSSIVQIDRDRFFRVIGDANLNHQLTRSWTARLSYNRGVGYVASFSEPFFTDGLTASVGGFMGRRLSMNLTGAYVNGDLGVSAGGGNGVKTYSANFTAQYAFSQILAADFSAYSYKYDFEDPSVALPGGLPGQFERTGVRAGLSLWLPLLR